MTEVTRLGSRLSRFSLRGALCVKRSAVAICIRPTAQSDGRYGCAVGRHVASVFESRAYGDEAESLHVIELGGGNGTVLAVEPRCVNCSRYSGTTDAPTLRARGRAAVAFVKYAVRV